MDLLSRFLPGAAAAPLCLLALYAGCALDEPARAASTQDAAAPSVTLDASVTTPEKPPKEPPPKERPPIEQPPVQQPVGDAAVDLEPSRADAAEPAGEHAGEPADNDAIQLAYEALKRDDKKALDSVIPALEKQLQQTPDDGYTTFYSGAMRLWKLSELSLGVADLVASPSLADEILSRLERARELSPEDFRIPGFLGLAQVNAGLLASNTALVDRGMATLVEAIAQFPAYGHFLRACSSAGLAKDDPLFIQGLEDMTAAAKGCLLEEGDEQTAYRYPSPPTLAPSPHVCMNDGLIPHAFEGYFILFGDMANKAGWPAQRVRALYQSAKTSPTYANWPFAAELEKRIANVEEDARLHGDANPLNDPLMWVQSGHICTGCHQER